MTELTRAVIYGKQLLEPEINRKSLALAPVSACLALPSQV